MPFKDLSLRTQRLVFMINFMSFFSATHGEAILEVGRRIKSRLDIRKVDIVFENHQDTQNKHGSRGKATYYL